jgi:hypothetical protein
MAIAFVVIMVFGTAALPPALGGPQTSDTPTPSHAGNEVSFNRPDGVTAQTYSCPAPDAFNLVDKTCSANDVCGGAETWPLRDSGTSTGNVGGEYDTQDWSRVEVYRTETLVTPPLTGFVVEQGGVSCTPSETASLYAAQNGWYNVRISASAHARYTLQYRITANDALSGKDVGNTVGDAWFINALPKSTDPTQTLVYKGSLPNREGQLAGPDQDWYRIGTSLAALSDPTQTQGPAVGLLTVEFTADCHGGTYTFGFYAEDGQTKVGTLMQGCGPMAKSCITTGATPVHAKMAVTDKTGTGYDFTAELVPLYLVDLSDGIPRPYLYPEEPWCDSLAQTVLEAAEGFEPGTDLGLVNSQGVVIARFQAR